MDATSGFIAGELLVLASALGALAGVALLDVLRSAREAISNLRYRFIHRNDPPIPSAFESLRELRRAMNSLEHSYGTSAPTK